MRIISQDKNTDVPYEISALEINYDYDIVAHINGTHVFMGRYKTEDDAKAVLWDIAANFKVKKEYYEMPQADENLEYAYRGV